MHGMPRVRRYKSMCGRYYVNDELAQAIEKLVRDLDESLLIRGEIFPDTCAAVVVRDAEQNILKRMRWGFRPDTSGKELLINARSESILRRPAFADSVRLRRCLVPASCFYEWDHDHNKIAFKPNVDETGLFMAGIWKYIGNEDRFVIITAPANTDVSPVHERMPLILPEKEQRAWIEQETEYESLLDFQPESCLRRDGYYQQEFVF